MRSKPRDVLTALLTVVALFWAMVPAIAETEGESGEPLIIRVDEPVDLTDESTTTSPPAIHITESIGVFDQPNTSPPLAIHITESIGVSDQPATSPPLAIHITENIGVIDQPATTPPLAIHITENITVTDQPATTPPLTIHITENITVTDSQSVSTDVGPVGSIGGLVWGDPNRNGVRDETEPVFAGATVFLDLDDDGVLDDGEPSTVTDASGSYLFPGLTPGEWVVRLIAPFLFGQVFPDPAVDRAHRISLQAGQEVTTASFGLDINRPPFIAPIPDTFAIVGQQTVITPITHDIEDHPRQVLWDGFPPEWLTDGTLVINGVFSFTPSQPGMWNITATVVEENNPNNFSQTTFRLFATGVTSEPDGQPGISDFTVLPGGSLTVSGGGFLPGSLVGIYLFSEPVLLDTVQVDGNGEFEVEVTIPAGTDAGEHQIIVAGVDPLGEPLTLQGDIVVESTSGPVECPAGSVNWTGAAATNAWNLAANWDTGVPGPANHVCIESEVPLTVTLNVAASVQSLTTTGNVTFTTGAQAFTATNATQISTVGNLLLTGTGNVTFTGGVVVGLATITGTGDLVVDQPSTTGGLALNGTTGSQVRRSNQATAGSLVVDGPMTWGGGAFVNALPVFVHGPSTWVTGEKQIASNAVLTLNGDTDWQDGSLQITGGGQLVINGTLNINHNGSTSGGTGGSIVNNGIISVNATGTTTIATTLTSNGTIVFTNDGTLVLTGNGTAINGTVDVGEGGELRTSGTHTWGSSSSLIGTGFMEITSGTLTIGGSLNFGGLIFIGNGNLVVTGPSVVGYLANGTTSQGNATFHNGVVFTGGAAIVSENVFGGSLFLDGPSVAGSLILNGHAAVQIGRSSVATNGSLLVTGPMTWGYGALTGGITVTVEGASTWLDGPKSLYEGAVLTLNGDTSWTAGIFRFNGIATGSLVNNGTLTIEHDAVVDSLSPGEVINNGTIHLNGVGTTTIGQVFENHGTITWGNPTAGLLLADGGTWTTEVHIPEGNTLRLERRHDWEGGSSNLTGTGNFEIGKGGEVTNVTFHDLFDFNGHITTFAGSISDPFSELLINVPASISSLSNQSNVRFMHGVEVSGLLSVSLGSVQLHGPSTAGALQVSGGLLGLRGETEADSLEVLGSFDWSGGTINGVAALPEEHLAVTVQGPSTFSGAVKSLSSLHMTLNDDTEWTAGVISFSGVDTRFTNNAVFTITHDGSMAGAGIFENNGPLHVNGTGTTTIQLVFNNTSTVTMTSDTSTLALMRGGTTTTSIDVPSGNTLRLAGAHNWTGGSSNLTGDGRLEVVTQLAGAIQPVTFHDSFDFVGDITASRPLHVHDHAAITSLTVLPHGTTTQATIFHQGVDVTGATTISGTSQARLDLRAPSTTGTLAIATAGFLFNGLGTSDGSLEVVDSFDWSGGTISGLTTTVHENTTLSGGQKSLAATLTLNGETHWLAGQVSILSGTGHVVNNGVFHVDHNATVQGFNVTNNGTLHVDNNLTVTADTLGVFTNNGLLAIVPTATLSMGTNAFVQTSTGTLRIGVTASEGVSQNGRLTGSLTLRDTILAGTLEVSPTPGFTPITGASYPLISKNGIANNAFTTLTDIASGHSVSAPPNSFNSVGHVWEVLYNQSGSNVILQVGEVFVDTTPPVVTILTPGDGAIYALGSPVIANFTCTDEESGIDSCIGTVAVGEPIDTDTEGDYQFTVTATDNAGNSTTVTHNYEVVAAPDITAPDVSISTPADGAFYEVGSTVLADYVCTDEGSGIATCVGTVANGAPINTSSEGFHDFTVTATDNAGNSTTVTHNYEVVAAPDITPPVFGPTPDITAEATGPDGAVVSFSVTATDLVDGDVTPVCLPSSGSTFGLGDTTVDCTATDLSGNSSNASFTVTVEDTTDPVVTITTPADGAEFTLDQVINAVYVCTDLVGIATCVGTADNGAPIDTSSLGSKTFTVTGTDNAGNETVVTNSYEVVAAPDTTPPVVTITTPAEGAEYEYGSTVLADYVCTDDESGIATCVGTVDNGDPIDTSTLGSHEFTVTGTDLAGNETTVTHSYEVVDTIAPVFGPTPDITAEATGPDGAVVSFTVTATDLVDGDVTPVCLPASGSTFGLGDTTVDCTASDTSGNTANASFTVTVEDTTAPGVSITTPADGAVFTLDQVIHAVYECTDLVGVESCDGTVANGDPIDTSSLGEHSFTVTATDLAGNETTLTHTYTIEEAPDTIPPQVTITTPADDAIYEFGSTVLADYVCTDSESGTATCEGNVTNGSPIDTSALGSHSFTVTATDLAGNETTVTHTYTAEDTTGPTVTPPADISVEATGPFTPATHPEIAEFLTGATATDLVDGDVTASITHNAPEAGFPLGTTVVTFTATDQADNEGTATASITITDTTPPEFGPTPDITVEATGPDGATVNYTVTATDLVDGDVTPVCLPASGSLFDLGDTTVDCTATDTAGNSSNASFTVTVQDTTDPVVTITAPADGATYEIGSNVLADYVCTDESSGIATCEGNVTNGSPIDTTTLGSHGFTVTGTDNAGNEATVTHSYEVVAAPDTAPPVFGPTPDITIEATGPAGAVVSFSVIATDAVDGSITPLCLPASGSTFGLGDTTVDCTATDLSGNSSNASFMVTVQDTTDPVNTITTPTDGATYEIGSTVLADYVCTDLVGIQTCAGPVLNGEAIDTASLGTKTFSVTGTDNAGNETVVTHTYEVVAAPDTTPPVVTITAPADGATYEIGSNVLAAYVCTDEGSGIASCVGTTANGSPIDTASLGTKTFNVTGTDNAGNETTVTHTYEVAAAPDTAPPVFGPTPNITVDATGPTGATVEFTITATDAVDGAVTPVCLPASGSNFGVGQTNVNCTATDQSGNSATATFTVTVVGLPSGPAPWTPGTVYNTGNQVTHNGKVYQALWWTQEQPGTSTTGAWQEMAYLPDGTSIWTNSRIFDNGDVVFYNGGLYRAKWWTRNQPPGDPWGPWEFLGAYVDPTMPVVTPPAGITVAAAGPAGTPASHPAIAAFLSSATAVDVNGNSLTVTHNAPSVLPAGVTTVVTFSATDSAGNTSTAQANITIGASGPPTWVAGAVYNTGNQVTYNGKVYRALWWTQEQPGINPMGAWEEMAQTAGGTAIWTNSRIFNTGDVVLHNGILYRAKWYTRNNAPGVSGGPWERIS